MNLKRLLELDIPSDQYAYEYDPRWGKTTGEWTTDMFIEAVYKSLTVK